MANVTRQPLIPSLAIDTLAERPKLTVGCGFREFAFYFDDCEELEGYLIDAVRYRGMPALAAADALAWAKAQFGSYEDGSDIGRAPEARTGGQGLERDARGRCFCLGCCWDALFRRFNWPITLTVFGSSAFWITLWFIVWGDAYQ